MLVLHLLTDAGSFIIPYILIFRDTLYFSQLGAGHAGRPPADRRHVAGGGHPVGRRDPQPPLRRAGAASARPAGIHPDPPPLRRPAQGLAAGASLGAVDQALQSLADFDLNQIDEWAEQNKFSLHPDERHRPKYLRDEDR